jgi:hypothetical protein
MRVRQTHCGDRGMLSSKMNSLPLLYVESCFYKLHFLILIHFYQHYNQSAVNKMGSLFVVHRRSPIAKNARE